MAAVMVVWVAYASAIFTKVPTVENALVQNGEMVYGNLILIGNVALFLSVIAFARFVYLHANELIKLEHDVGQTELQSVESSEKSTFKPHARPSDCELGERPPAERPLPKDAEQETESDKILSMPLGGKVKKASQKRRAKKANKTQRRAA